MKLIIDNSPERIAQARSYSYSLFGRLFLEGVTETLWPYVQAITELQVTMPPPFSADEAAATHYFLFAFNLFPYETIFLDSSGLLGGELANAVEQSYGAMGFTVDTAVTSTPDHLGHELLCLNYLSGGEALAWKAEQPESAYEWQRMQRHFLEKHLLRWLIPFTIAIEQLGETFYTSLTQLTLALAADQYTSLVETNGPPWVAFTLPDEVPPVDDARTGLRQIIHYLLTPRQSGFYLTRRDIETLAYQLHIPAGFGRREELLRNVWGAAGQYDCVPELLHLLQGRVRRWQLAYDAIQTTYPALLPFGRAWQTRTQQSERLLAALETQLPARDESAMK